MFSVFSVTFRDATNQAVSCRLVKEVRGLNPTFDAADIRGKFAKGVILLVNFKH